MATSTVFVRCPECGTDLRVALAPQPPTQWFPCPHCRTPVPVVVPRDPPPLYSWEVLPGLYPALPRPRVPRWRVRRTVAATLLVVTVISAALAAGLVYAAWEADQPATFTVDGTVEYPSGGGMAPLVGATVTLTDDANQTSSTTTGLDGGFSFAHVMSGGVTLNVSDSGYAPITVLTFVSSVYQAPYSGLVISMTPGSEANGTVVALSPFPDLEQFLASVGAGAVLLALVAFVAAFAAVATVRADRPALGVVGGAAGLFSPVALFFLAIPTALPLVEEILAAAAAAGAFALAVCTARIGQTGPAPDPD
jgi:hypothetical protein